MNSQTNTNDDRSMDEEQPIQDGFYASDVQAAAMADNNMDPDDIEQHDETPVTTGDMKIGNLDDDAMEGRGNEESYDEESVPAGDNVVDN